MMSQLVQEEAIRFDPIDLTSFDLEEPSIESDELAFEDSWQDEALELWSTSLSLIALNECGVIRELEAAYIVRQPIPYEIECIAEGDCLASFVEANIAIGGTDPHDAFQALVTEILNTFDTLTDEESRLGQDAAHQLDTLRAYIERA